MTKFLGTIVGAGIMSLFYFPFEFSFLPAGLNTKMMLAFVGILLVGWNILRKREAILDADDLQLIGLSLFVSLVGVISITYNNTQDNAYSSYIISAATWFLGAYTVIAYLKSLHSQFSWEILVHYLAIVCVFQCLMAELIDNVPSVKTFVDSYVNQGQEFLDDVKRLYGIGASLDVAGIRFSAVIILIFYLIAENTKERSAWFYLSYMTAILFIIGIGNIIARTTIVGAGIGLIYFIARFFSQGVTLKDEMLKKMMCFLGVLLIIVPIVVILYNVDENFRGNIRFGFEGFFSLVEKGRWEVSSNETLKNMYVFPETIKTWIIGDGYFSSPRTDPYFIGKIYGGYYMGTDVGYLRFIFYFGLIGLVAFSLFLVKSAFVCVKRLPHIRTVFWLLLLANFVVWTKVATDLFVIFALFLNYSQEETEEELVIY